MILAEILPRDAARGEPVEFEVVISEEGVPVFTSWQPFATTEDAEAVVRRHYSLEPVTLKTTDRTGKSTVQEIR
jgi:hypothetical protein